MHRYLITEPVSSIQFLNQGTFGKGYRFRHRNRIFACKMGQCRHYDPVLKVDKQFEREIKAMKEVHNSKQFASYFAHLYHQRGPDHHECYVLQQYGGEEVDYEDDPTRMQQQQYTIDNIWNFVAQVSLALIQLKMKRMVHADLKLNNIVRNEEQIKIEGKRRVVQIYKVIDLGSALQVKKQGCVGIAGTYKQMAPEVLREQHYSYSADVFSLGASLYLLATKFKRSAFYGIDSCIRNVQDLVDVLDVDYLSTSDLYRSLISKMTPVKRTFKCRSAYKNKELDALVQWMMNYDPKKRPTPEQILRYPPVFAALTKYHGQIVPPPAHRPKHKKKYVRKIDQADEDAKKLKAPLKKAVVMDWDDQPRGRAKDWDNSSRTGVMKWDGQSSGDQQSSSGHGRISFQPNRADEENSEHKTKHEKKSPAEEGPEHERDNSCDQNRHSHSGVDSSRQSQQSSNPRSTSHRYSFSNDNKWASMEDKQESQQDPKKQNSLNEELANIIKLGCSSKKSQEQEEFEKEKDSKEYFSPFDSWKKNFELPKEAANVTQIHKQHPVDQHDVSCKISQEEENLEEQYIEESHTQNCQEERVVDECDNKSRQEDRDERKDQCLITQQEVFKIDLPKEGQNEPINNKPNTKSNIAQNSGYPSALFLNNHQPDMLEGPLASIHEISSHSEHTLLKEQSRDKDRPSEEKKKEEQQQNQTLLEESGRREPKEEQQRLEKEEKKIEQMDVSEGVEEEKRQKSLDKVEEPGYKMRQKRNPEKWNKKKKKRERGWR